MKGTSVHVRCMCVFTSLLPASSRCLPLAWNIIEDTLQVDGARAGMWHLAAARVG